MIDLFKHSIIVFGIAACITTINSQTTITTQYLDSLYSLQPNMIKKYLDHSVKGYFKSKKNGIFLDGLALLNSQVNIGYTRQLTERISMSILGGINRRYDRLAYFLYNHFSSSFIDVKKFSNAFNSANFDMSPFPSYGLSRNTLVFKKDVPGKVLGIEFSYFFSEKVYNGSAMKFCYKYKDAKISVFQGGTISNKDETKIVNIESLNLVRIDQNQLYFSLSHFNRLTIWLYSEFSISAGINVLKYNLRLRSVYDVYDIDELRKPYNNTKPVETIAGYENDKVSIKSGKNLFIPDINGKNPIQIAPYFMLDFRLGFNY